MTFLVFKKCCFCVDLRVGCFIIGYLTLLLRLGALAMFSIRLAIADGVKNRGYSMYDQDPSFHRLIAILSIMILVFETLLCIALVVGLHKRLDQHLEMFYVGSFAFLVLGMIITAAVLLRYAERFGSWEWLVIAVEIVVKLVQFYILGVIRSYYYKMKDEQKDDLEKLSGKDTPKTYFARTKPVLISSKP